jgi:beta-glucosidase
MKKLCSEVVVVSLVICCGITAPAQSSAPASRASIELERRVDSILKQMTIEEKVDLIGGVDDFFVRGIERLKLPRLKMADGPNGVRNYGPATAMPSGIALAATWNPALADRVGTEIGRDARAKGVHFLLGPGVNIYRSPLNGRNFEYYGEDPFLAARIAVAYIKGVQSQSVAATVKHYMGNNSEFDRHNTDSVIDERTMREIYLPVFEAAVREARVGAIMDSYNLINGTHASQHGHLNNDVAKKEWGFDGIVMSDWGGTYDTVGAANGGLDLEMPSGVFMNREKLLPAIKQGKVSVATIEDKVRRILRTAVRFGWLDREQTDLAVPRFNQQGRLVALDVAREGMVLLRNEGELLPLNKMKIKSVAVIGPNAYPAVPMGGGSGRVEPFAAVSFMEGLSNAMGTSARVYYHRGIPTFAEMAEATNFTTAVTNGKPGLRAEYFDNRELKGSPVLTRTEEHVNFRRAARGAIGERTVEFPDKTLAERWTGYYVPQSAGDYHLFVESTGEDGGSFRLYVDDKLVLDNWTKHAAAVNYASLPLEARPHKVVLEHRGRSMWLGGRLGLGIVRRDSVVSAQAKALAAKSDAVVLAVGFDPESETEAADRTFRLPPGQDELIREIAAQNKNTIVVVTSGGGVDMNAWHDRVRAIVQAWYPGQEGGTALAEIIFGDVNPSGRLPATFERRWEDNPVHGSYYPEGDTKRVVYKEGVFVGYRGYESKGTKPLFPFGHGLSYTTFLYENLSLQLVDGSSTEPGGPRYEISFDVRNTGSRMGADVAQVYVGTARSKVPRPVKELKRFAKVSLRPGESKRVSVGLNARAFSYYDVDAKRWVAEPGEYEVLVGRSSEQIELRGKLTLPPAAAATR